MYANPICSYTGEVFYFIFTKARIYEYNLQQYTLK